MEKKKNNLMLFVVVLIALVLGLSGFIVYDKVLNNNEDNSDGYTLNVLGSDFNSCSGDNCSKIIYTIKTNTEEAKILRASDNFVLYNDIGLKVYDRKNDKVLNIELDPDYNTYTLHLSEDKSKVIGIIAFSYLGSINGKEESESVYYNILLNKKMYENKYFDLLVYDDNFIAASDTHYPYNNRLLYISKEEIFMEGNDLMIKKIGKSNYIFDYSFYKVNAIYTIDKKLIATNIEPKNCVISGDYLYILKDNIIEKYNENGNVEKITNYKNPLGFIGDFIVYVDNSILKLKNFDKQEELKIADWNNKYELTNFSAYLKEENKICIALKEKGKLDDYGNELVGVEYYYNLNTKEITIKQINGGFSYQAWD